MQTFSVFCQKTSSRIAKTETYVSTRKLGRKIFCWKKCVCAILYQKWAKNFWPSGESFSAALWKLLLMCPLYQYEKFFSKKSQILFEILAHWANPFRHSVEDFWAGLLENTILIFNHFRILSEQFSLFWRKKAVGLSKPLSTCLQEQFENNNFLKKNPKFLSSFPETKRTKVWFFSIFF